MDMSTTNSSTNTDIMMVPWLHFIGGDNLFLKSLHPSSPGAIAGACIFLAALALFERWLSGLRTALVAHWAQRARALSARKLSTDSTVTSESAKEGSIDEVAINTVGRSPTEKDSLMRGIRTARRRTSLPFIASHDIPRGMLFVVQALVGYMLMLAVMTFQAAYLISIVVGLGIGEIVFGRMGGHALH